VQLNSPHTALGAVVLCFVVQAALALAVIPPWQNPDEPQHLVTVQMILKYGRDFPPGAQDPLLETAIIQSMARHRWWDHYGHTTPDPLPTLFAEGPAKVIGGYFGPLGGSRLYYSGIAAFLRIAGIDDGVAQLYAMRAVSAFAGLLTIGCVWAATRRLLGWQSAVVVSSLIALHTQFVMASTSASPDAVVNLAGAVVWWQGSTLLAAASTFRGVVLLWAAAIFGFLIRRSGALLMLIACVVSFATLVSTFARADRRAIAKALLVPAAALLVAAIALSVADQELTRGLEFSRFDPTVAALTIENRLPELPSYLGVVFTTFWLMPGQGWLLHMAPSWWYGIAAIVMAVAAVGLLKSRTTPGPAVLLAMGMVMLQIAAVVVFQFGFLQVGAHGRYLFPASAAVFFLVWYGWRAWFPRNLHALAAVSLVTIMAVLNITAWVLVVMPAFA